MKLNTSYIFAALLAALIALWFVVNNRGEEGRPEGITPSEARAEIQQTIPTVRVQDLRAQTHDNIIELYGQTEAIREVSVKAETAGLVVAAPAREGAIVQKGAILCQQDVDARQAMLDQARANQRSIETDLSAARVLADKGYQSQTRVTAFEAQLDGAKAAVKQAEIELDNVNMRAPFRGVWERQLAELGDYLAPGQPCGLLVDLSPLNVVVDLTEGQLGQVTRGDTAQIVLATGETITGTLALIEAKADSMTRTFRAELRVPNANFKLRAGVTGTVRMKAGETLAHKIPTHIFTLDDLGNVGVRYVDDQGIVRFARIKQIDEEDDGAWVTGLPPRTRLIVDGQDFVAVGQKVIPDASYSGGRSTTNIAASSATRGQ